MKAAPDYWYNGKKHLGFYLLIPLSWVIYLLARLRRIMYKIGILARYQAPVPVIVVGNITAGGCGKTPLVIWLAQFLQQQGYRPGIVSRGYGGQAKNWPQQVRGDSDYVVVGDEAIIIAARAKCPMAVGPQRSTVVSSLLAQYDVDVIVSDDGLQHYALRRDIEVAVVDGERRFGNGYYLPAGPLREHPSRLDEVDVIVVNGGGLGRGYLMSISNHSAENMHTGETRQLADFADGRVHAVAGIGNPARFFASLQAAGLQIVAHEFPDHHPFTPADIDFADNLPVLMTEKDAVKCVRFSNEKLWRVPADVKMSDAFGHRLIALLQTVRRK